MYVFVLKKKYIFNVLIISILYNLIGYKIVLGGGFYKFIFEGVFDIFC